MLENLAQQPIFIDIFIILLALVFICLAVYGGQGSSMQLSSLGNYVSSQRQALLVSILDRDLDGTPTKALIKNFYLEIEYRRHGSSDHISIVPLGRGDGYKLVVYHDHASAIRYPDGSLDENPDLIQSEVNSVRLCVRTVRELLRADDQYF